MIQIATHIQSLTGFHCEYATKKNQNYFGLTILKIIPEKSGFSKVFFEECRKDKAQSVNGLINFEAKAYLAPAK
jgi:hypothetical protein